MARKSKQKRPGIKEKPKTRDSGSTKPEATVTPIRRKQEPETIGKDTAPKRKSKIDEFIFAQILPHEIEAFVPLITDFYKEINLLDEAKQAMPNEEDEQKLAMPMIRDIYKELMQNPYSIIYACVDRELKPHGYYWLRVETNPYGQKKLFIEHDYIIPEHRGTMLEARMHDRFIAYSIEIAERCNVVRVDTIVKTPELRESRKKLGFHGIELKMRFEGDARKFKEMNPRFEKYSRYVEKEKDDGRKQTVI